jgi:aryl-alcohol dehydrogenase-like predicted oxidoreductase
MVTGTTGAEKASGGMDRLGLGTVQFGLDYGISNTSGRTPQDEVGRILATAARAGIRLLDTAALYGNSEEALGLALTPSHAFKIVTKTPKFTQGFGSAEVRILEETLTASLHKLGQSKVYALLAHQADDLLGPGGDRFLDALRNLKARGLVAKVGASIYTPKQADKLLELGIDIIQVPFNLLDQRLLRGGQLQTLKSANVEVHARSVFLQGVILMNPDSLPPFLTPIKPLLERFRAESASKGLSPLESALAFTLGRTEIAHCLVGVVDVNQLTGITAAAGAALAAANRRGEAILDWDTFHCEEERFINPALWVKT